MKTKENCAWGITIILGLLIHISTVQSQTKIMPLGDSITFGTGSTDSAGFRNDLAQLLVDEGVGFDFVGSQSDGTGFPAGISNNHEGIPGQRADEIVANIGTILQAKPDIVLLHIGTNDLTAGDSPQTVKDDINGILDAIHNDNPNTIIILSAIIPRKDNKDPETTQLRDLIRELYLAKRSAGFLIFYAGHNEVFKCNPNWQTDLMSNDKHPNDTGYALMAQVYFNLIMNALTFTDTKVTDNFERSSLGGVWMADADYTLQNGDLVNTAPVGLWEFLAVYNGLTNADKASMKWSTSASDLDFVALALKLDSCDPNSASGYGIQVRSTLNEVRLWAITNGVLDTVIAKATSNLPDPLPGDVLKVQMSTDASGNHFDVFINDQFDRRLTDPNFVLGNASELYAGILTPGGNADVEEFSTESSLDNIAPDAVVLSVSDVKLSSVTLNWTATGDDGLEGTASTYDLRYSTSEITAANVDSATKVTGLPIPDTSGTPQSFTVTGLSPGTQYYFSLIVIDESGNASPLSNVPNATTVAGNLFVDNFNRASLDSNWIAHSAYQIFNNQLRNTATAGSWDQLAILTARKNPEEVSFKWAPSPDADAAGIDQAGFAFVFGTASITGNGYAVTRRTSVNEIRLWEIQNGQVVAPPLDTNTNPNLSAAGPGDEVKVVITSDVNGNHFDFFKNGALDGRVSDAAKTYDLAQDFWTGVALRENLNNDMDDFTLLLIPGAPSQLNLVGGDLQQGTVGQTLTTPLQVQLIDDGGIPVDGVYVDFVVTSGTGATLDVPPPRDEIVLEAENGTLSGLMTVGTDATASNGKFIHVPDGTGVGDGVAEFTFNVDVAGDYVVWGRAIAPDGGSDVFKIHMDGGPEKFWDVGQRNHSSVWFWDQVSHRGTGSATNPEEDPVIFTLTAGTHTLMVNEGKDGTKLDQILITNNLGFVPSNIEVPGGTLTDANGIATANLTLGTVAGSYTVEASFAALTPVVFTETAVADSAETITKILGDGQTAPPGQTLTDPFGVELRDQYGNLVPNFDVNFDVILGNGSMTAPNPVLTNDQGQAFNTFTLATDTARNEIKVTAPGYTGPDIIFTIFAEAGPAAKIQKYAADSGDNQTGTVGTVLAKPFKVQVTDDLGSPVSGFQVTFTVTGGGGNFSGSNEVIVTTDSAGIAGATLTLGPQPGVPNTAQATASLSGSPVSFTANSAAPQTLQAISALTQNGTVNLPLADSISVKVLDALGNPLAGFNVNFAVTAGGGKVNGQSTPQDVPTDANGVAMAEWRLGPTAGDSNNKLEVSASFGNQGLTGSPIAFTASAQPGAATTLEKVSGDSLSSIINSDLPAPFVVRVTDGVNPVVGWPVLFTVVEGGGSFNGNPTITVPTNGSGEASAMLTLGSTSGTPQNPFNNKVQASADNNGPLSGSPITFVASAVASDATTLSLVTSGALSGVAGEALPEIQVKITDSASNSVPNHPVNFSVTTGAGTFYSTSQDTTIFTDANGVASVVWVLGCVIGDNAQKITVTATDGVNNLSGSPMELFANVVAGPVDPDASTLTADPASVPADGSTKSTITATLTDKCGNPIAGRAVIFMSSDPADNISQPTSPTDANGQVTGTISSTVSGTKTISARDVVAQLDINSTTQITFQPLAADNIALLSGNNQQTNVGTAVTDPVVVIVKDKNGNPVPGFNVNFEVTGGGGLILENQGSTVGALGKSALGIVTDNQGKASATWVVGPNPGANSVQAQAPNLTGSPVQFSATGVTATATTLSLQSGDSQNGIIAGLQLPDPLAVKVTDANGKPVWNVPVTFTPIQGGGTVETENALTDYRGIAQTIFTQGPTVGTNIVQASNAALAGSPVTFTFESVVGTPAILEKFEGDGGSGEVNSLYTVKIRITDINGNPIQGAHVDFEVIEGGATIESENNATFANGRAIATVRLPNTIGTVKVKAISNDLPGFFVVFTVNVVSGAATDIAELSGNNQDGTFNRELVSPLEVKVTDAFGNPVAGVDVQWIVTQGGGSLAVQSPNTTKTDTQGIASNRFTVGSQAANEAWAIVSTLNGSPVKFMATGVSNNFPLFVGLRDTSVVEGNQLQLQVTATDDDGDPITYEAQNLPTGASFNASSQTFTWTPTDKQAGVYPVTFIARDNQGGLDSETIDITVLNSNHPPVIVSHMPEDFELAYPRGGSLLFSVNVQDQDGDALLYTWKNNGSLVSTTPQYDFLTDNLEPASYIITLDVTDTKDTVSLAWKMDLVVSVELSSFMAQLDGFNGVKILWNTSREIDNLGFNVLRSLSRTGNFTKLNDQLIPPSATGAYQFKDAHVVVGQRYYYILEDVDVRGAKTRHGPIFIDVSAPKTFELSQNFPNPFNPETKIRYQLPDADHVVIKIFDVLGRAVRTLVDERKDAGFHVVVWDARDDFGAKVGSGVYYYQIVSGQFRQTKKMVLLK
ncbi:MAG: Ig-like domain-containing protein [bacterium]